MSCMITVDAIEIIQRRLHLNSKYLLCGERHQQ